MILDPGSLMVLDENGVLKPSHAPYDKQIIGVVSA